MNPLKPATLALTLLFGFSISAAATPIVHNLGDYSKWQISQNGGLTYSANQASGSITPSGGTPGVWQAKFDFDVPADAPSVELKLTRVGVDDRVVLKLNGNVIIGSDTIICVVPSCTQSGVTGSGKHDFGDGQGLVSFDFVGGSNWVKANPIPLIVNTGFLFGQTNSLIAYVNNTGDPNPISALSAPPTQSGGSTVLTVTGDVTIPEPDTLALFGISFAAYLVSKRKRIQ